MSIFDDSFSIELNYPMDKEAWKVIEDAELDNTEHICFTTLGGERVDFIRSDVLDKIRAEIDGLTYYWCEVNPRSVIDDVLNIIDKYRAESEDTL